jgi:peptidoglycan/LPS O-acetylase OafA/YrhL
VRPVAAWLRRAVAFVAGYSYSLYLIHATIIIYWASLRPDTTQSPTTFLAILVVANAAAILFWWAFERHYPAVGRALKRRFLTPSRTAASRIFHGPRWLARYGPDGSLAIDKKRSSIRCLSPHGARARRSGKPLRTFH